MPSAVPFIFLRANAGNPILPRIMKNIFQVLSLTFGLALLGTGCASLMPSEEQTPVATQADVDYLRGEIRRLQARLDASEAELGRVQGDVAASQTSQPGFATAAQLQSVQTQLDGLQGQIRALDAARAQDKQQIYDDISKKISTILKSAPAAATPRTSATSSKSRSGSQSGIEHVVQPGESLSKIASAYGVKMDVIVSENGLSDPGNIRVGQKLFIPDN